MQAWRVANLSARRHFGPAAQAVNQLYFPFKTFELPYEADALEPVMSARTMSFHHGKHHQAYINKANELLEGPQQEHQKRSLRELVEELPHGPLFNQCAQHWNHSFFWLSMQAPVEGTTVEGDEVGLRQPEGDLLALIERDFGSVDEFRSQFEAKGAAHFGSGWVWLVQDIETMRLEIVDTHDAENPLRDGKQPLLVCDVWEHAAYLDYQNRRPDYLRNFWKLANFDFAASNLLPGSIETSDETEETE
ncbi:MAG: hypothetical protein MHM6MM_003236 [Cercozoa sp. M6MM]